MSPRSQLSFRTGTLAPVLAAILAVSAITLVGTFSFGAFGGAARLLEAPSATELAASLARVGVTAESLAAAGCSEADAANVGLDAKGHLDATRWAALQAADGDVREARAEAERLGRLVRAGQATAQDLVNYDASEADLAAAISTRDGLLGQLFDAAVADLAAAEVGLIGTMHGNRGRPVAMQYRVTDRTDQEWTGLRDALANLKTSAKCGEDPDSGCSQLVSDTDAEDTVATAKANLAEPNLSAIAAAYTDSLGQG